MKQKTSGIVIKVPKQHAIHFTSKYQATRSAFLNIKARRDNANQTF